MSIPSRRRILTAAVGGAAAWGALSWARAGQLRADSESSPVGRGTTRPSLVRTTRALGTDVSVSVIHADAAAAELAVGAAARSCGTSRSCSASTGLTAK